MLEIDELRGAVPPPLPPPIRRLTSEPPRGYSLEAVSTPLELQHVRDHVAKSRREGRPGESARSLHPAGRATPRGTRPAHHVAECPVASPV